MRYLYELPWPPSANHSHIHRQAKIKSGPKRGKTYTARMLSDEVRGFRQTVLVIVRRGTGTAPRLAGRLALTVLAYPPDYRGRDLDNLAKQTTDALGSAGVFLNDSQIDATAVLRGPVVEKGLLRVSIEPYDVERANAWLQCAGLFEPGLLPTILGIR